MSIIRSLAPLVSTLLLSASAFCGPLEEGREAFRRQDYPRAWNLLQPLADQGNAQAETLVGVMYFRGLGVAKDAAQGMALAQKAAAQGDMGSENFLGNAYENGSGVNKDYGQAMAWYRKAAEQGDSTAENNLGTMYLNG